MFRYERGATPGTHRLIDEDRRVSLRSGGGEVVSTTTSLVLSWDGREVPTALDGDPHHDPASGEQHWLHHSSALGSSWDVTRRPGVQTHSFRDPQERAGALVPAVEAVLVDLSEDVKGDWDADAARVAALDREWRASDSGDRTSSDIGVDPHGASI